MSGELSAFPDVRSHNLITFSSMSILVMARPIGSPRTERMINLIVHGLCVIAKQ